MDTLFSLLGLNLGLVLLVMAAVWWVSIRIRDVSIVDIAWGANGALVALVTFLVSEGTLPRRILLTGMVAIWGIRLAIHIGRRKKGRGEDFRYAAMRREHCDAFPMRSLLTVFLFQAVL
ncbi:MAG: DUF1295 domain-containing protein, partial [Longimicrobiales bacterium]